MFLLLSNAGLVASLQANDLPNPVVEVCVLGNAAYHAVEVAAARTLQVGLPSRSFICAMALRVHESHFHPDFTKRF